MWCRNSKTCRSPGELAQALKGTMTGGKGARQTGRRSGGQMCVTWPTRRHHREDSALVRPQLNYYQEMLNTVSWTDASFITTALQVQ